jgi:hypothetical protein
MNNSTVLEVVVDKTEPLQYTGHRKNNSAISKVIKEIISHPFKGKPTLLTAETVQVSYVLPSVCISYLLRSRKTSFQDGVTTGDGYLCASF